MDIDRNHSADIQEEPVFTVPTDLKQKYETLLRSLQGLGRAAVAFSGGVDSTFLLFAARESLGQNVLALTASAPNFPKTETQEAENFCREREIRQIVFPFPALDIPGFRENPPDRCYHCKRSILGKMMDLALAEGFPHLAEGTNIDDASDYRPGERAVRELGVLSPLRDAGLSKSDIRALSHAFQLPTQNKPSLACLASRFPYGQAITPEKLSAVEQAERHLFDRGFHQVRLRVHGNLVRLELLPGQFHMLMDTAVRQEISSFLKNLGFAYVSLDLDGYRTGSMNETIVHAS